MAVFRDKKILMVRTSNQDDIFYTLGGKIKQDEADIDCLKREVWKEVGCGVEESSLKFLAELKDVAHGKDEVMLRFLPKEHYFPILRCMGL